MQANGRVYPVAGGLRDNGGSSRVLSTFFGGRKTKKPSAMYPLFANYIISPCCTPYALCQNTRLLF
jgi:hypothetical protein